MLFHKLQMYMLTRGYGYLEQLLFRVENMNKFWSFFVLEKKCFDDFRIIRPCWHLIHTNYQYVLVWKTWLNNALVYQFQSGLKSITTNVARSYAVSTSKIFMMGRKKEESLIFLYFTLKKMKWNSVQLNQSIKQTIFLRHLEAIMNEKLGIIS